jgi:Aspartyl protease
MARLHPVLVLLLALAPALPARPAPAPEPGPEAVLAELPFLHPEEPNRVYVDLAEPGGKPFVMMLDTGAAESVVTPLTARKLGISVRRNKQTPYRRGTRLGRDVEIWVDAASSDTGSRTGWEYGLLGGQFLAEYVVEIDFPARRVRFLDKKKYAVPEAVDAAAERVLPFQRVGNRIHVPVEIGGQGTTALLDTGAPPTVVLSGKAAGSLGVDVASLPYFARGGTTLGPQDLYLYEAPSLRFAGFDLGAQPLLVAPRGWYNIAGNTDSVIGVDVLRGFVLRIDYPRRRLWLKRVGDGRATLYGADYATARASGAFLGPADGAYLVWRVEPGGPAARYGLREGDAVVPAVGQALPPLDEVLAAIREGRPLLVARKEGDVWVDHALPGESVEPRAPAGD